MIQIEKRGAMALSGTIVDVKDKTKLLFWDSNKNKAVPYPGKGTFENGELVVFDHNNQVLYRIMDKSGQERKGWPWSFDQ